MSNTLKLSDSHIEGGSTANPQYKKYEDKLRQMKNQDGEIDVAELCQVLDEASTIEKHRKLLRGACYVLAVFSLLTIAVIVGLTYAIVDLTQDSQVSSSDILVTKNSAANPVATGRALLFDDASQLFNKDLADLSDLKFLILPSGKTGAGTVVHVAEVELDPNTSAKVTTTTGAVYEIDASGIHHVNKTSGGRRRLLQTTASATSGFTSSTGPPASLPAPPPPTPLVGSPAPVGNLVGSPAPLSPTPTTPLVGSPPPLQTSGVATSGSTSSSTDLTSSSCDSCSCATPVSSQRNCCEGSTSCNSNGNISGTKRCPSGTTCSLPETGGSTCPPYSCKCSSGQTDCDCCTCSPNQSCCDIAAACTCTGCTFTLNAGTKATCQCTGSDGSPASMTCPGGVGSTTCLFS